MTWYTSMCGIMAMDLLYELALWSTCACVGTLDPMVLWPMMQPFPMDGHFRRDVISSVGHLRLDSVVPLVLHMVCFVQWLGHWHCTTDPSGQRQPCWEGVISRVDHNIEVWLLLYIICIYYIVYITYMITIIS